MRSSKRDRNEEEGGRIVVDDHDLTFMAPFETTNITNNVATLKREREKRGTIRTEERLYLRDSTRILCLLNNFDPVFFMNHL
jgi:hypothetical protein